MFERVEYLISAYMKRYEVSFNKAIDIMLEDLKDSRKDKDLNADCEEL